MRSTHNLHLHALRSGFARLEEGDELAVALILVRLDVRKPLGEDGALSRVDGVLVHLAVADLDGGIDDEVSLGEV